MYQVEDIRRRGETIPLDVCASTWQNLKCSTFGIHFQNASRGKTLWIWTDIYNFLYPPVTPTNEKVKRFQ